ncbi:MAG: hypothetical protein KGJ55_10965 [Gammaproteobacteria bacterium]|nr:hypothetical protein [Gammaproteobacteria bacterium]
MQTKSQIVAMDPETLAIVQRAALPPACRHDHGLSADAADRLAFVACDGNARCWRCGFLICSRCAAAARARREPPTCWRWMLTAIG